MNLELVEDKVLRIKEIYADRGLPNAFRMRKHLNLAKELRKYSFGEFVGSYKQCNGGYV